MATTLYLKSTAPVLAPPATGGVNAINVRDASRAVTPGADTLVGNGGWGYALSTTIGTGTGITINISTVAGTTAGVVAGSATTPRMWVSPPIAADITVSGTVSLRANGLESSMNANATFRYAIYRVDQNGALTLVSNSQSASELGTALAARDWTDTPTSTDFKKGDRVVVIPLIDDGGGTMASGHTVTFRWDGSNANIADSFVQFTEDLTFITSAPSGSVYYLRDTASDVNPGSATEKALSTTQGSGTATAVHGTLAGPLTFPGDQWTVTSGGGDVEWISPQYEGFTLGGVVQVDVGKPSRIEAVAASAPYDSLNIEIAVVDADGTNPVVWATSALFCSDENTASISSYYVSGPDTSVSSGKRLRLRFYSDDQLSGANDQDSGTDRTIRYDGTSSYASRLIFTQTLTEFTPADLRPPPVFSHQAVHRAAHW